MSMNKHTQVCAAKESITCCFDNGEIISFQDNFKYLGDAPFTVYRGHCSFLDPKMFAVSYCQIYSFHPSLNL